MVEVPAFVTQFVTRFPSVESPTIRDMSLDTLAIILAVLGAGAQVVGLGTVVWQIKGDRDRARSLLDKQRKWKPPNRPPPRRVGPGSINVKPPALSSLQVGSADRQLAGLFASLVNGHNQMVRDTEEAIDKRTAELLDQVDEGDKELRDVLRELLGESIKPRVVGVVAIGAGIILSMAASILSTIG